MRKAALNQRIKYRTQFYSYVSGLFTYLLERLMEQNQVENNLSAFF